jgi:hypothetical protein
MTLFLYLVLHAPVVYKEEMLAISSSASSVLLPGAGHMKALAMCFYDPLTIYYLCYLAVAVLGYSQNQFFNAILLFDILVKNSTSRDVLIAVTNPIKQLMATLGLALITIYVFSFLLFLFYVSDEPLATTGHHWPLTC